MTGRACTWMTMLLFLGTLPACGGGATVPETDGGVDANGPDAGRDAGGGADSGTGTCTTHEDCACPEGICLSTGECWCPPCETDDDCAEGLTCYSGTCVVWPEGCNGPLRMSPDRGPETGGTLLVVEGGLFHIGALDWWAILDDGDERVVLSPIYMAEGFGYLPCNIGFMTPPMPPGTYPVHVFYGWPPFEGPFPEEASAGTFTFEPYDGAVGRGFCRSSHQCEPFLERCDLGTGRCVPAVCASLVCEDWSHPCDDVEGCLDPDLTCLSSADCKRIRSSCGCHAVHIDDPRTELTSCALGGCEVCTRNHCDSEHIEAVCRDGRCIERRGDPRGASCGGLAPDVLQETVASGDWIRGVRAASLGEHAALAWTQAEGEPYFRYGVVRAAVIDGAGQVQGEVPTLTLGHARDSNPAVAADDDGFGVVWTSEQGGTEILFQRLDPAGGPLGEPATVADELRAVVWPRILRGPAGFDVFWDQTAWGENDGLYHASLTPEGALTGIVDYVGWMIPDGGQMDVIRHRDRFAVAWRNRTYGFEGLFWAEVPLAGSPVWLLTEEGHEVVLTDTGIGFAAVWRETGESVGGSYSTLHFMSFDQDGAALTDPVYLHRHQPLAHMPRVTYLGGVFLVTWKEQDGYADDEPGRVMAMQLTETGGRLTQPEELLSLIPGPVDLFLVRLSDTILVGTVEPGEDADTIRLVRFDCMP